MFTLKVTDDEIQKVLKCLKANVYPSSIGLWDIAWNVFYKVDSRVVGSIELRKVRLCIKALRKQGYLIIAKRGYSMDGDDPEPTIHFINGMYSRAYSLTVDADIMFHELKKKYGDAVSEKVEMIPGQPGLNMHVYDKDGTLLNI